MHDAGSKYGAFFDVTFKRWSMPFQGAMHDGKGRDSLKTAEGVYDQSLVIRSTWVGVRLRVRVRVRVRVSVVAPLRVLPPLARSTMKIWKDISPISPLYLPYIFPISPLYLPDISPISARWRWRRRRRRWRGA